MAKKLILVTAVLLVLGFLGYVFTIGTGKAISTDLSSVGQGKPTLVLAYENFSTAGGQALNRLRDVRADYDSRIDFLVADLGTPQGRAFARRHDLLDGVALFLSAEGEAIKAFSIPADQNALRAVLGALLGE